MSRLYLLYDGTDADVMSSLATLPLVEVMMAGGPLAEAGEADDYRAYLARHDNNDAWRGRPGNYQLLIKQGEGREWEAAVRQEFHPGRSTERMA